MVAVNGANNYPKVIGGQLKQQGGQAPVNTNFKTAGPSVFTDYSGMGNATTFGNTSNAESNYLKAYLDGFESTTKAPEKSSAEKTAEAMNIASMVVGLGTAAAGLATGVKSLFVGNESIMSSADAAKVLNNPNASKSEVKQALASATAEYGKLEQENAGLKTNLEQATTALGSANKGEGPKGSAAKQTAADAQKAYEDYKIPAETKDSDGNVTNQKEIDSAKKVRDELKTKWDTAKANIEKEKASDISEATTAERKAKEALEANTTSLATTKGNVEKLKTMLTEKKGSRDGAVENDGVFKEAGVMKTKTDEQKQAKETLMQAHSILTKSELSDTDIKLLTEAKDNSKSLTGAIEAYAKRHNLDPATLKPQTN